jgi:hypothetical protein
LVRHQDFICSAHRCFSFSRKYEKSHFPRVIRQHL